MPKASSALPPPGNIPLGSSAYLSKHLHLSAMSEKLKPLFFKYSEISLFTLDNNKALTLCSAVWGDLSPSSVNSSYGQENC